MKYSKDDFVKALKNSGLKSGDLVMVHVGMSAFGALPENVKNQDELSIFTFECLKEVLGEGGTLVVPAFSYSFGNDEVFDAKTTPCPKVGAFCEWFRKQDGVRRSNDPFLSVCAFGKMADELTQIKANTSYGKNSFFDRFTKMGGKISCLGVGLRWATIAHYFEEEAKTPNRYKKFFSGMIKENDEVKKCLWIYSVRAMCDNAYPAFATLEEKIINSKICKKITLAKGFISTIKASDYKTFALEEYKKDPWLCAKGPACDIEEAEKLRTGEKKYNIELKSTDIKELATKLSPLPRNILGDAYDAALFAISKKFPLKIHKYNTGESAFSWIVPERWILKEASLKAMGKESQILKNSDLAVISYSKAINKMVSKEELLAHIYTPREKISQILPDALPFMFKYYEKDWGFCLSKKQKDEIINSKVEQYEVKIDSDFSFGSIKIGEYEIKGKSDECVIFCAHLDHPCQFNNGLSGVIAGLKVLEKLQNKNLRYTYKLIILPETIGSACYLSHNEDQIYKMRGGVFLETLANDYELNLMSSNQPNSYFDMLFNSVIIKENVKLVPFLSALLNDERMFNAPGINVPMLSLQRISCKEESIYPYPYYHTDEDTPQNANFLNLDLSIELLDKLILAHESDFLVKAKFKGELFISSFSEIDYSLYGGLLRKIMYELIEPKYISQIALNIKENFFKAKELLDILKKYELVEYE